ncbi:hypothetical protein LguiA_002830 [Lonicera macranthoides]
MSSGDEEAEDPPDFAAELDELANTSNDDDGPPYLTPDNHFDFDIDGNEID